MNNNNPRVSIGLPVFNGEKYLKEAIDAILAQTFQNFELIISDNGSTDHTRQICLDYASREPRIRYYRNKKNLGGPNNYNQVFKLSLGEYFKWAACDDLIAPEFLTKCVRVLDHNPSILGCYCKSGRINKDGVLLDYYNQGLLKKIDSLKARERFRDLIGLRYTTTPFYGLYRTKLFAKTPLQGSYIGADRNLVAELGLMGRIYEIPECLFFWRDHPDSYTSIFYGRNRVNSLDRLLMAAAWWGKKSFTRFPHWKNCVEYFRSVNHVSLSVSDRILCYVQIFRWFLEEGYRFMAQDIIFFLMQNSNLAYKIIPYIRVILKRPFQIKRK